MNAHFTKKPSKLETQLATYASEEAQKLVREFAGEVGDAHEWPNKENVDNTRTRLLAYIAGLESECPRKT